MAAGNAWVCFQCLAHGTQIESYDKHYARSHTVSLVDPTASHRWATIHGQHPRKAGSCAKLEHLEAVHE